MSSHARTAVFLFAGEGIGVEKRFGDAQDVGSIVDGMTTPDCQVS
jgi:hypothetical protein